MPVGRRGGLHDVVGVRDDATGRQLLEVGQVTLKNAILDICKASEETGRQVKAMATPEDVQVLVSSSSKPPRRAGLNEN